MTYVQDCYCFSTLYALWLEYDLTSGHLANVGISFIIQRDTIKEASIHGYFRPFVVHTWLRISPFRNIQLFSTLPYPNPVFLLQTNEPRINSRSIPSSTLLNLMIDKLPFFLSLDWDQITSQDGADFIVIKPVNFAFRKYVRGVFETGWLALYKKKINE